MPHDDGLDRGWADRLAAGLALSSPELLYANLAVRGRRIGPIRDEQLEPALALEPDLVSVMAGANDMIRPGFNLYASLEIMDEMQSALRAAGATVVTNTFPKPSGLGPAGRLLADRSRAFNEGLREVAIRNGALLLDLERIPVTTDPRLWCHDRLHLNPEGHRRMAMAAMSLIEGETGEHSAREQRAISDLASYEWAAELPVAPVESRRKRVRRELGWAARYLAPWIGRRLTGRSSGDGRSAKRPGLAPAPDSEAERQRPADGSNPSA